MLKKLLATCLLYMQTFYLSIWIFNHVQILCLWFKICHAFKKDLHILKNLNTFKQCYLKNWVRIFSLMLHKGLLQNLLGSGLQGCTHTHINLIIIIYCKIWTYPNNKQRSYSWLIARTWSYSWKVDLDLTHLVTFLGTLLSTLYAP